MSKKHEINLPNHLLNISKLTSDNFSKILENNIVAESRRSKYLIITYGTLDKLREKELTVVAARELKLVPD